MQTRRHLVMLETLNLHDYRSQSGDYSLDPGGAAISQEGSWAIQACWMPHMWDKAVVEIKELMLITMKLLQLEPLRVTLRRKSKYRVSTILSRVKNS